MDPVTHDVFIEANYDHVTDKVEIAVLCSCTALLWESPYHLERSDQISLDEAVDAAWKHRGQ